jgi:NADP-dependent 3-hydroxy acid dehydrogenase YdfG
MSIIILPADVRRCARGDVDILFNCAGLVMGGTMLECGESDWASSFDINVSGADMASRVAVRTLPRGR